MIRAIILIYNNLMKKYILLGLCVIANSSFAQSEEDSRTAVKQILKIEDLLPQSKSWTITTGLGVSQNTNSSFNSYVFEYQVAPNVTVPYVHNENTINRRSSVDGFMSLQYGLTKKISPYISLGGGYQELVSINNGVKNKSTSGELDNYSFGLNYQFDSFQPFNILMVSYSKSEYVDSTSLSLFSSWIFDPIVLSLNTTYQYSMYDAYSLNLINLKGTLAFAVNPEITIRGGFSNKFSIQSEDSFLNSANLNLGIGMNLSETITMSTGVDFSVTDVDYYKYNLNFTFKV